jgi:hypothetical protein
MRTWRFPRALTAAALGGLAIGCQSPAGLSGFYVLQTVDSLEIPRVVSSTVFCDELILSGRLHFTGSGVFDLSVVQSQDCTRQGAAVDTFTTALTGTYSVDHTRLSLTPPQSASLQGTASGGIVDVALPALPLLGGGPHSGRFVIFPL